MTGRRLLRPIVSLWWGLRTLRISADPRRARGPRISALKVGVPFTWVLKNPRVSRFGREAYVGPAADLKKNRVEPPGVLEDLETTVHSLTLGDPVVLPPMCRASPPPTRVQQLIMESSRAGAG